MKIKIYLLIFFSICFAGDGNKSFVPKKIDGSIVIDGNLDEPIWNSVNVINDFVILDSDNSSNIFSETELKILYNDNSFYFGVILYDDLSTVSKKMGENDDFDNVFYENSDYFIIEIDSHHDHQSSYGFAVNSSNIISDYIIYNNEFFNDYWNGEWKASVSYFENKWIIEYEIPIKNLRFENGENVTMGINFLRYKKVDNTYFSWVELPQQESAGIVSHYGHMDKLNLQLRQNKLSIKPNIYYQSTHYDDNFYNYSFDENGNISGLDLSTLISFTNNDIDQNLGIDIKYLINSNTSLDFTINPEFYNEQDPSEINNSAFETYFEEKRPFFIEQSQIFITPIEIFYSRRIGENSFRYFYLDESLDQKSTELESNVDTAFKLTGQKHNGFSYGLIFAQGKIENSFLNMDNKAALYSIFRTKKEMFNDKSYIGFLSTNFNFDDQNTNVYSIDGLFDLNQYGLEFSYQYAKSIGQNKEGLASTYELDYYSKPLSFFHSITDLTKKNKKEFFIESWIKYDNYDENFDIDHLGYLFRNNLKSFDLGLVLYFFNDNIFDMSSLSLKSIYSKNYNNVVLEDIVSIDWNARLLNNWSIKLGISCNNESYLDKLYEDYFNETYLLNVNQRNVKISPQKNYYFNINSDLRKRIYFSSVINYFTSHDSSGDIDDDGFSRILESKIKLTNSIDIEFIVDDLSYSKTFQFLKIRKINLPNGGGNEEMSFFQSRNDYRYLFTNSQNNQNSYVIRMNAFMKKNLSMKFYIEYFNYENKWDEDSFSYIDLNSEPFSYPEPHPNYLGDNQEDILLYSAKFSSLSYNIVFDMIIREDYFMTFGFQYNKGINGRNFYKPKDIIQFDQSLNSSDKAELFYDSTFFVSFNMIIGD